MPPLRPSVPHRRRRALLLGALATGVGIWAGPARARVERPRLTAAVGGKGGFYFLPLTLAEQLGYFREEGLDLSIQDLPSSGRALQAVQSGNVDLAAGAYEHAIAQQARGQGLQAFVQMGRVPQTVFGVSHRAVPNYREPTDLIGRRIGVATLGPPSQVLVQRVLARAGMLPGDVQFVDVGSPSEALGYFRAGQIDAISYPEPLITLLEQRSELRLLADTRTLRGTYEVFGGPMPAACFYAPLEFVQRNPETCQALTSAVVRALKWLQTAGPGDLLKAVPERYLLGDRSLYLESFFKLREAFSPDGLMPEDGARTALRVLAQTDPLVRMDRIDLARTVTNDFAYKARLRYRL